MSDNNQIKVYWQPGCTSCLRTKEFLQKHGIEFVSVNVLEDGFDGLEKFGLQQVPIVTKGDEYVNGQVLSDVARIVGIKLTGIIELPPEELFQRLLKIQQAACRYLQQVPDEKLGQQLPKRPRSYAQLAYHIFNIADAFLEHERGIRLEFEAYNRVPKQGQDNKADLTAYSKDIIRGLQTWWLNGGAEMDFSQKANVYYGDIDVREFLERTTWHSAQHTRQLMLVIRNMGISLDSPLGPETFADLPMPEKEWDDEETLAFE